MSDEGGRFATPFELIEVRSPQEATVRVAAVVSREGVECLVVGLPLNMDGTLGGSAHQAVTWGRDLSTATGKPVLFIDERLSSFEAEQRLVDRKRGGERLTRGQKKRRLDSQAAALFLQEFLDGRLMPVDVDSHAGQID